MKAFIGAVTVLLLLAVGVILSSAAGLSRVGDYLDALPPEEAPLGEAAEALGALYDDVLDDLLLINAVFPHAAADALLSAIRRTEAAAAADSREEYAVERAELYSLLLDMQRDLAPHITDVV